MDRAGYCHMLGRALGFMMAGSCFSGVGLVPMPREAKHRVTTKFSDGLNGKRAVARRRVQRWKREEKARLLRFGPDALRTPMRRYKDDDDIVNIMGRL